LASFPTPRILKKDTKKKESFSVFKLMGPQNRFYNRIDVTMPQNSNRWSQRNDTVRYCITSDAIFPVVEDN
jgi:hypothetical protein